MEVTYTFLTTVPFYFKRIYKQPTLTAVHHTNLLATDPNLYLALTLYQVNTIYKNEAIADVL